MIAAGALRWSCAPWHCAARGRDSHERIIVDIERSGVNSRAARLCDLPRRIQCCREQRLVPGAASDRQLQVVERASGDGVETSVRRPLPIECRLPAAGRLDAAEINELA